MLFLICLNSYVTSVFMFEWLFHSVVTRAALLRRCPACAYLDGCSHATPRTRAVSPLKAARPRVPYLLFLVCSLETSLRASSGEEFCIIPLLQPLALNLSLSAFHGECRSGRSPTPRQWGRVRKSVCQKSSAAWFFRNSLRIQRILWPR